MTEKEKENKERKRAYHFYWRTVNRDRFQKYIETNKQTRREYYIKRKYNTTIGKINKMRIKQNNKCAICRKDLKDGRSCHIDHEHDTGTIRGLLCAKCNVGLGMFDDNKKYIKNALKYLSK